MAQVTNSTQNEQIGQRVDDLRRIDLSFHSDRQALAPYDLSRHIHGLQWVITGGENGRQYRPVNPDWFRTLRDQCAVANVPFLFKQWEGETQRIIKAKGRQLDGVVHDGYPAAGRGIAELTRRHEA